MGSTKSTKSSGLQCPFLHLIAGVRRSGSGEQRLWLVLLAQGLVHQLLPRYRPGAGHVLWTADDADPAHAVCAVSGCVCQDCRLHCLSVSGSHSTLYMS